MKMTYKIALIVSAAAFVLAVVMFTGPTEPEVTTDVASDSTEQPQVAPRKSLLSDASPADQGEPTTTKPAGPATMRNGKQSLSQDVRSRILAAEAEQAKPSQAEATPVDQTVAEATHNAITLSRTGTDTPSQAGIPETKPAPILSRQDLDAILGPAPTSAETTDTVVKPNPAATPEGDESAEATDAVVQDGKAVTFAGGKYLVQPDDTFSSIAAKYYGDVSKWRDIAQANPRVDPVRLRVGQELTLPAMAALPEHDEPAPQGPGGVQTYTIRPGDSLSTVAEKYYDDPTLWRTIYNFNKDKIGDNPNAIKAGMPLKVPPRPTAR